MELAAIKSVDVRVGSAFTKETSARDNVQVSSEQVKSDKVRSEELTVLGTEKKKDIKKEDLENMTVQMNKFMELLNADLKFYVHERTKILAVQVVSTKDDRVLKEFPPKEFLDTIANIREYVGLILDKKA